MAFDLKKVIGTIAPTLATMLGGPLAGTAVSALASALGMSPGAKEGDITKVLQTAMTPETIAAVRKADQEHAVRLRELDVDLAKLNATHREAVVKADADDRDSARQRQVQVRDHTPTVLAYGLSIGFFGILAYLLQGQPPEGSRDVLNIMLGSLGTAWVSMIAYYFGSSAGSARKTELLSKTPGEEAG